MVHSGRGWEVWLSGATVALLAGAYLLLARRARHRNPARGWPVGRTTGFLTGCGLLAVALLPPVAPFAEGDFRGHMVQHMLLGMYAPLALALGVPVTLLLRTLPAAGARHLTGLLRSRPLRLTAHPVTALLLSTGSLVPLYFTPLYDVMMTHPVVHGLVHVHFVASGWLFAWVVAGPDPAPRRPSVPARLAVLAVAVALHACVSQLMYGGFLIDVHAPVHQVRGGAEIMYFGGDIAELLLTAALVTTWRPVRGPRDHRRDARPAAVEGVP